MDQVSFSAEQFAATAQVPSGASTFLSPGEGLMQLWVFGILVTLKISGNETGGGFSCMEALIPAGNRGPLSHYHTREDEYWLVMDGEFTGIIGGKEISAPKGFFIHIPRGVLHAFENRSNKPARVMAMYTPGKFLEWFAKVGIPAEKGASEDSFPGPVAKQEDLRMAIRLMEDYGVGFAAPAAQEQGEDIQHGEL